ncbi:hypothetical protein [Microbacterium sp.]|uniref:hypothetical protein n=1 Tax=Microbacterium sp. TaxID=51671 RepID=UPI00333F8DCC
MRFSPAPSVFRGEPDNLGVAGLPMNLVATASAQTQQGDLFGFPIRVRFTPVEYVFVHGDGSTATHRQGGATWAALKQAPFTPTATSHVYADRGTYAARVDVRYRAEIDLGTGWQPVDGLLTSTGPTQDVRIFEARTALVAHTCQETPQAPGC